MRPTVTLTIALAIGILIVSGCGGMLGGGNNSNASNANNSNANNTNRDDNNNSEASATPADKTPLTLTAFDMTTGSGDEDKVGRMATVTGGDLEKINYDSLLIRSPGGYGFYCYGDFSDYMKMADRVSQLSSQGKAPRVTVKGIYKIATVGTGAELNPCVLSDMEKP